MIDGSMISRLEDVTDRRTRRAPCGVNLEVSLASVRKPRGCPSPWGQVTRVIYSLEFATPWEIPRGFGELWHVAIMNQTQNE
jgi:hypothetical protein